MIDRRAFLGLSIAVPAVCVCTQPNDANDVVENKAPRDTDDREYDEWLDDYGKDERHL